MLSVVRCSGAKIGIIGSILWTGQGAAGQMTLYKIESMYLIEEVPFFFFFFEKKKKQNRAKAEGNL